jgi:hypothetical protein
MPVPHKTQIKRTSGLQWLIGDPAEQLLNGEVNDELTMDSKGW